MSDPELVPGHHSHHHSPTKLPALKLQRVLRYASLFTLPAGCGHSQGHDTMVHASTPGMSGDLLPIPGGVGEAGPRELERASTGKGSRVDRQLTPASIFLYSDISCSATLWPRRPGVAA